MPASRKATKAEAEFAFVHEALESLPLGVAVWDRDFRLVTCNRMYRDICGLQPGEPTAGLALSDMIATAVAVGHYRGHSAEEALQDVRQKLFLHGRTTSSYEHVAPNGSTFKVTATPASDGAWVVTLEDITEIKRHIEAQRAREEEITLQNTTFDFTVRNMRQGLCMFNGERKLVFFNPQYAEMYRISHERIRVGMTLEEVLDQREAAGSFPVDGRAAFMRNSVVATAEEAKPAAYVVEMQDGRAISILHQPLPDGGWVATHWDVTEEQRNEARVRHLARHDPLTDLPNRILLREHLEDLAIRAERGEMLAVLCIDLDHFKTVNDTLGHDIGDEVLKEVSRRLLASVRETDVCARLGGDEFAILYGPLQQASDAAMLANRIVDMIAEPFNVRDRDIVIGASVGIAISPRDACEAEALLKAADLACYRAKHCGRGTYQFFERSMDAEMRRRRDLELGLRVALKAEQLELAYQPQFDLRHGNISGVEALLRWRHPELGDIAPSEFVSVAEETGLIREIGAWVLHRACATAAAWPPEVRIAVNLSPVQFKQGRRLTETVAAALAESGLDPRRLELEITESVLLFQMHGALKTLHGLRDLGVRICMDDFGTGYSSLSYLRAFPFDRIKIDRTFVQDLELSTDGSAIIAAVVGLGRTLGMSITAEGVETPEQLRLVKRQGCDEAQGFLLSRPVSCAAVSALLDAASRPATPQEAA